MRRQYMWDDVRFVSSNIIEDFACMCPRFRFDVPCPVTFDFILCRRTQVRIMQDSQDEWVSRILHRTRQHIFLQQFVSWLRHVLRKCGQECCHRFQMFFVLDFGFATFAITMTDDSRWFFVFPFVNEITIYFIVTLSRMDFLFQWFCTCHSNRGLSYDIQGLRFGAVGNYVTHFLFPQLRFPVFWETIAICLMRFSLCQSLLAHFRSRNLTRTFFGNVKKVTLLIAWVPNTSSRISISIKNVTYDLKALRKT